MRLAVGLGSNLGDRLANLRRAVGALREELHHGSAPFLVSGVYATEPVDCAPGTPEFFNAAVELECSLDPLQILRWTQNWEETNGRPRHHGFHEPRTVDLDLLYYGDTELQTAELILPHPRMHLRLFVLCPLAAIAPHFQPPGWPQNIAETCQTLLQETLAQGEPIPHLIASSLAESA